MNHTTRRTLHWSLLLVAGAAFYLSGCGPENLDDPAYLSQMSDSGAFSDAADKDAHPGKMMAGMRKSNGHDADNDMAKGNMNGARPAGAPLMGAPGVAAPAVVAPLVELPPQFVREPGIVENLPPVITNTGEDRQFTQKVFHEREDHRFLPSINQHLIRNNLLIDNKYHTTVINHPSFRNDVAVTSTVAAVAEVLPTTEVTTPVAVVPGIVAAAPVVAPVLPACAPYLSGGFWRYCGGPNRVFPVNGPYYR